MLSQPTIFAKILIDIGLRCRNNNIGMIFISSLAYSSKVNPASIQQWNGLLFDECRRNGFKFVDNGSVSGTDLWTDRIHLIESGKGIIANNLINSSQYLTYQFNIRSINNASLNFLLEIRELRLRNVDGVLIGNLNINSIRNKFDQSRDTVLKYIDILILTETKFDGTFLISQFLMDGFSNSLIFGTQFQVKFYKNIVAQTILNVFVDFNFYLVERIIRHLKIMNIILIISIKPLTLPASMRRFSLLEISIQK